MNLITEIFCKGPLKAWDIHFHPSKTFKDQFIHAFRQVLFMIVATSNDVSFCAYLNDLSGRLQRFMSMKALAEARASQPEKVKGFLKVLQDLALPCKYDSRHGPRKENLLRLLSHLDARFKACRSNPRVQAFYRLCLEKKSWPHCTRQRWLQLMTSEDITEGQYEKARTHARRVLERSHMTLEDMEERQRKREARYARVKAKADEALARSEAVMAKVAAYNRKE